MRPFLAFLAALALISQSAFADDAAPAVKASEAAVPAAKTPEAAAPVAATPEAAESIAKAEEAALAWLALTDAGKTSESLQAASSSFRAAIQLEIWEAIQQATREPLGATKARTLNSATPTRTVPKAPDGEYVILKYDSQFAERAAAVETVTVMRDNDGVWRVSGYYFSK